MPNPQVHELIRDRHSGVAHTTDLLRDVAIRFLTSGSDLLAVAHNDGRLAGIVTESAVVRSLLCHPSPLQTIETCINCHVESVRTTATLNSVLHLFRASCHTAIPVVDMQDRVCGLLLRRDVMAAMLHNETSQPYPAVQDRSLRMDIGPDILQANFGGSPAGPDAESSSRPDGSSRPHGSESELEGPWFLKGEEARRRLGSPSDFHGGFTENPW